MMMRIQESVIPGGAAVQFEFPHKSGLYQPMQCVVNGGPRRLHMPFIQRRQQLIHGGVIPMPQQIIEHRHALGRTAQPCRTQRVIDFAACLKIRH